MPALRPDVTPPSPAPSFQPYVTTPSPAPSFQPDVTPPSPAPSFQPDVTPPSPAQAFQSEALRAAAAAFKAEITPTLAVPAPLIPPPPEAPPPAPAPAHPEGVVELRAEDAAAAHTAAGVEKVPALRAQDASAAEPPALHTPGTDADVWGAAAAPAAPGPTPWSEPAAPPPPAAQPESPWDQAPAAHEAASAPSWEMAAPAAGQVVATEDVVWSAPPPAEPVTEWKAEAPSDDWQSIKKSEAPPPEATSADWSTISRGPDWSAPPPAAPASDEAWGAAPPPPAADAWSAAPSEPVESEWSAPAPAAAQADWAPPTTPAQPEWAPPAAPAQPEWPAPAAAPTAESAWSAPPPKAWGGPPVGASALQQLDSEQMEADPAAAKELFGSVPAGGSLSGDDDLGPPEELASPEEVLKPVEPDDDPNLLVPVDEPEPPPRPAGKPLAMMRPPGAGALEVWGEYRVAIQTRGGSTRRGTVKDIDLSKSQFALLPQGGRAVEPVYHAEVKAIFFMLAPGERPENGDGGKVRVTFADGRTIEGTRDGPDAKHGFFLVPTDASRTNTRRIYIAREATSKIEEL